MSGVVWWRERRVFVFEEREREREKYMTLITLITTLVLSMGPCIVYIHATGLAEVLPMSASLKAAYAALMCAAIKLSIFAVCMPESVLQTTSVIRDGVGVIAAIIVDPCVMYFASKKLTYRALDHTEKVIAVGAGWAFGNALLSFLPSMSAAMSPGFDVTHMLTAARSSTSLALAVGMAACVSRALAESRRNGPLVPLVAATMWCAAVPSIAAIVGVLMASMQSSIWASILATISQTDASKGLGDAKVLAATVIAEAIISIPACTFAYTLWSAPSAAAAVSKGKKR